MGCLLCEWIWPPLPTGNTSSTLFAFPEIQPRFPCHQARNPSQYCLSQPSSLVFVIKKRPHNFLVSVLMHGCNLRVRCSEHQHVQPPMCGPKYWPASSHSATQRLYRPLLVDLPSTAKPVAACHCNILHPVRPTPLHPNHKNNITLNNSTALNLGSKNCYEVTCKGAPQTLLELHYHPARINCICMPLRWPWWKQHSDINVVRNKYDQKCGFKFNRYREKQGARCWWRSRMRHCATSRKAVSWNPDDAIGIFHWHNPSGRTIALGWTYSLTELSKR